MMGVAVVADASAVVTGVEIAVDVVATEAEIVADAVAMATVTEAVTEDARNLRLRLPQMTMTMMSLPKRVSVHAVKGEINHEKREK